eukprot:TRINITY_DN8641_c0_g1_i1.p1 TRINITY_DN8641_c0_g1~~TRINITY_DN8641_c0_g1_i1.p1  ORF type:complete len:159 (+),score=3.69 TRINITY_DN8641_c0_g1_i1:53-529(+)
MSSPSTRYHRLAEFRRSGQSVIRFGDSTLGAEFIPFLPSATPTTVLDLSPRFPKARQRAIVPVPASLVPLFPQPPSTPKPADLPAALPVSVGGLVPIPPSLSKSAGGPRKATTWSSESAADEETFAFVPGASLTHPSLNCSHRTRNYRDHANNVHFFL